jgi:hypothetical protein
MKRIIFIVGLSSSLIASSVAAQNLSPKVDTPADKRFTHADRIFSSADTDRSKTLSRSEFTERDRTVKLESGSALQLDRDREADASAKFDRIDANGDGFINRKEFRNHAPKTQSRPRLQRQIKQMPLGTEADL